MATQNGAGIAAVAGALLNSYAEFTAFTPVIAGSTLAGVGTYTTQAGSYYKIGKAIFANVNLTWTAHTGTGNMLLTGLPFTCFNNANFAPVFPLIIANIVLITNAVGALGQVNTNATTATLFAIRSNSALSQIAMDTSGTIRATIIYQGA